MRSMAKTTTSFVHLLQLSDGDTDTQAFGDRLYRDTAPYRVTTRDLFYMMLHARNE